MGVSRRSYAAQRGVSEAAVRKASTTGRITTLPDGTIIGGKLAAELRGIPTRWRVVPFLTKTGLTIGIYCQRSA